MGTAMALKTPAPRAIAFIDGQNLFHSARSAFGYAYPNYDVRALSEAVCRIKSWSLEQVRFYTGIPSFAENLFWNRFWSSKLGVMGRQGVRVYSRPLRYRNRQVGMPDGTTRYLFSGEEKGIDVRIALDVMRLTYENACEGPPSDRGVSLPPELDFPEQSGHQQDRLDPDRPADLRFVLGPAGLPRVSQSTLSIRTAAVPSG